MHERPAHRRTAPGEQEHAPAPAEPDQSPGPEPEPEPEPERVASMGPVEPGRSDSPAAASRWLWAALVLAAAGFAVAGLVTAGWRPLLDVDEAVARWFHVRALAHPGFTDANRVLTDWVWDPVTMRILIAVAALALWLRGEGMLALWCLGTSAVGTGVQQALKALLNRDRPHWEHPVDSANFSAMPSGHAMTAAVTCALAVWLVHRSGAGRTLLVPVLVIACVSVVGVCLTRIALGVHWLTDTVVGTLLGVALAAASAGLWNALTADRARRAQAQSG